MDNIKSGDIANIKSNELPAPKEVLQFQLERNVKNLFKQFLILMEDLAAEHEESFRKLRQSLPQQSSLINQADYLSDSKQEYLRKKVLGMGNDTIRAIKTDMELFDVNFKNTNKSV